MACRSEALAKDGGEGGIRTLDDLAAMQVFETCSFNRSDTSPM